MGLTDTLYESIDRGSVIDYGRLADLVEADPAEAFQYFAQHSAQVAKELRALRESVPLTGRRPTQLVVELERLKTLAKKQDQTLREIRSRISSRVPANLAHFIETGENWEEFKRVKPRRPGRFSDGDLGPNARLMRRFAAKREAMCLDPDDDD
jgi:hypothetical protein